MRVIGVTRLFLLLLGVWSVWAASVRPSKSPVIGIFTSTRYPRHRDALRMSSVTQSPTTPTSMPDTLVNCKSLVLRSFPSSPSKISLTTTICFPR